jgi:hypothetical protein
MFVNILKIFFGKLNNPIIMLSGEIELFELLANALTTLFEFV